MARIAALNDFTVGSSDEEEVGPTREALEAEASKNYNEAIRSLAGEKFDLAYSQFCLVLENPFIEKACWPEGVEPTGALPHDLALRYSCLKNMGNLSSKRGEYDQSVEYYMEAVRLDRTDVTIWQRLGAAAIKLKDFELALVAFQEGYNVNPKHWPCLDQLLSVLFILKMYMDCLGLAIYTLQRDPGYIKALAFKDKIFEMQPSLKEEVKFFFRDSSVLFGKVSYDKVKGDKFISTCETLRPPNKVPQPLPTIPCQRIRKPLGNLSWENLAKSLISTYDALMEEDGMAFAGMIDVCDALNDVKTKTIESDMEELGVTPLEIVATVGRKDRKSKDDAQENPEDPFGIQGPPIRISGRRRTIELGESQDSFRVSEKRRSIDSDASRPEDAKSNDGAAMAAEGGGVSKDESQKEKSAEEEKDKGVSNKEMEDHRSQDKSGSHAGETPVEDGVAIAVQGIEEPVEDDLKRHVGANAVKQVEECVEEQVKYNDDVGKEERELSNVQNLEASGEKMESSNAKPSPTDEESNNDFQGFTNASAYKEKHLKLVQGKSALCVIDEEDFGMEPGDEVEGQVQGTDSAGKEFNDPGLLGAAYAFSSERDKDGRIEEVGGRENDPNMEPSQCQVEEEDIAEKTDLLQEETEIENQAEEYVEKVDNGNEVGDATGQGEYENRTMEEIEQCREEGQEVSEGGGGLGAVNEGDGIEEEQEEGEGENMETGGGIEHAEGGDHIEENDDVGMEENDGGMEEFEGGMEENGCGMGGNVCEMERNEGDIEENDEGMLDENDGDEGEGENEGYQEEEEEGMEDDGMLSTEVTETEAAVNALKGIMALQPTEILGLPEPDFDYENEYVEYFDGGVYEEEEEEDMEEEEEDMNQGEDEQQEEMPEIDESQEENTEQDMEAEEECDNDERPQQEDSSQEDDEGEHDGESRDREAEDEDNQQGTENIEKQTDGIEEGREDKGNEQLQKNSDTGKETESKDKSNGVREKERGASSEGEIFNVAKDNGNKNTSAADKRSTDEDDTTTAEASNKAEGTPSQTNMEVARKSKRTKRGLERELEQLDYWGRRQERDAKRRRRTISSKLLGAIEEAEYLTWADLLRSFVPSALLNVSEDKKKKGNEEKSINSKSDSQTASVTSSNKDISVAQTKETSSGATAEVMGQDKNAEGKDAVLTNGCLSNKDTNGEMSVGGDAKIISLNVEKMREETISNVLETKPPQLEKVSEEDNSKETIKAEVVMAEEERDKIGDKSVVGDDALLLSSSSEEAQVQAFLMRYKENGGILHLLQQFLRILMKRHKYVWPTAAAKMFIEAYPRVRNHVSHGSPLNLNESREKLYEESMLSLTHWELCCSVYQTAKLTTPVSDRSSLPNPFTDNPDHLEEDMFRLVLMLGRGDVWVEETPQFHTRLRWLQAQIRLIRGQPEDAVSYLELLSSDLDRLADEGLEYICNRARTEVDTIIVCNSEVKRQLNVLQRSHMLEQVVDNYTDCRYRDVADLLTTIFHEPLPKCRSGVILPTRQTQLAILIDSLYKLSEYKDVMTWGSHSLTEALMRYNRAEADEEKNRWAKTLMKITETMNTMLTNDITVVCDVDRERLIEVVSTLIRMLVIQLERPQSVHILPFETLTPWMLLHRLLAYEESLQDPGEIKKADVNLQLPEGLAALPKTANNTSTQNGSEVHENTDKEGEFRLKEIQNTVKGVIDVGILHTSTADGGAHGVRASNEGQKRMTKMPIIEWASAVPSKGPVTPYPSTLFLITAHDELGKHSWCCYDEGTFLLYCLDVLLVELRRLLDDQHRQLLHHTLEQVTFCLYSHPSKKSKHKHLRDHGVPQIAFCWERAMQLYQYYRPNVLPDFQTSQIPSITDDAAVLFKRIIALLPDKAKPSNQTAGVEAYINGEVAECNYSPFSPPTDIISDCFYLLGDYYFKSKEWMNAIKYYKLDLSINHERLESWAPLGLAMKAILESQLNSCEVIEDEEAFFSLAKAAVQCLRQALKLDQYHINLWVEFGGLVYMVHSHASRLLKQDLNPDISLETFDMLEKLKNEMLNQAEHCFTKALSIQEEGWDDEGLPDERWLHCYMLGKVAEKMSKPPQVIIQYYMKAARYLHNIQAKYPIRINYNSPQEFSVEALEMYYRVHAFMLKYLHQREGRDVEPEIMDSFIKFLDELAVGPFTNCQEKKNANENAPEANTAGNDDVLTIDVDDGDMQRKRPLEKGGDEPSLKRLQNDTASKAEETELSDKKQDAEITSKDGNAEGGKPTSEKEKESDDEIQVVEEKVIEKKDHFVVISRCLTALRTCLSRFQEHYKAMYRLAQYYHTSKFHKDNNKAQNYLLGCQLWQNVGYMPVNGLFNERKVWIQQPKNCNFFHGVWRIPNDEIDRPGSFAAHMYRCVSLILDILPQMKDFFMILQIALALKNSPDKDKKYLRDNERELLSEHATQVGLQAMKDKYKVLFKASSPVHGNRHLRFLLDVYKSYKQISKHLPGSEPHFAKMLTDTYASYKNIKVENRSNVLREADSFCNRHQYLQHRSSGPTSNINNAVSKAGNLIQSTVMGRRGRPPLTGRGRGGRGRGAMYNTGNRTVGDMLAVQQAYKIYESLINTQTLLNKKGLNQANVYSYQKQLEGYQAQLMKYLTIPCVSHYFQSSLQGLGTTTTKLPPPKVGSSNANSSPSGSTGGTSGQPGTKPDSSNAVASVASQGSSVTVSKSQSTQPGIARPSLSALAARSQAHGISITSVSPSKLPSTQNQPLKPSMSVTVSPVKSTTCPPPPALKGRDVSVVAVSHSSTTVKASSVSPLKMEANKLPSSTDILPSSTTATFKPATSLPATTTFKASSSSVISTVVSSPFKPLSSSTGGSTTFKPLSGTPGGSTTFKPLSSTSGGSTTFKPLSGTSGGSTTFKPLSSTSGGSTTFKPATSSGSSVPKLPAGTTLTRPRDISSSKGSSPRPQLQSNPHPVKDAQPDNVSTTVKKAVSSMSGISTPVSKPNDSSTRSEAVMGSNKPTLPKGMTITPAPRIKTQPRQQMASTRPASSPSTSFFRAFEASLGLSSSKNLPERTVVASPRGGSPVGSRTLGRGQTTSISNAAGRVKQLSTKELMQLAYGSERGQASGGHGQTSSGLGQSSSGHGQTSSGVGQSSSRVGQASNSVSTVAIPYSKSSQQQQGQTKQPNSSQLPQGSTLVRIQSTMQKSQTTSSAVSQPQAPGSQQQLSNPQQSRTNQQSSNASQSKTVPKSNPPKPSQKPSNSSDDIITLD